MTNKEFYKDKLLAVALENACRKLRTAIYGESCAERSCYDCEFYTIKNVEKWLNAEYEEPEPPLLENGDDLKPGDWISVKDRLPEDRSRILVVIYGTDDEGMRTESGIFFAFYKGGQFFVSVDDIVSLEFNLFIFRETSIFTARGMRYEITHWMPLPELPVKENNYD